MDERVHIMENTVRINRWFYNKPTLKSNEEGNIILIFQYSVGPCEWWQWSIDAK